MKQLFSALLILISINCFSQTTGFFRYDTVRIQKVGANSTLIIENATRDSLGFLYNYGGGRTKFEVIRSVPGGIKVGNDTIIVDQSDLSDRLISGGQVTYSGTGLKFYISPAVYVIDEVIYTTNYDSVTLSASDPADPRKDVIYLATTGVEVLEGTPAGPAAEPQLDAGQIKLTVVDVPAGATTPGLTQNIIWDENTESVVTNVGTTTDPDNLTNVYHLTKSINVTNINAGDEVILTLPSTVNLNAYDGISLFLKLKAILPSTVSITVAGFLTGIQVTPEIGLGFNRNFLPYQGISLAMTRLTSGASNTFIDKIRFRFTGTATVQAGFYLDYIYLESGVLQPGGSGTPVTIGPIDSQLPSPNGWTANNNVITAQTASQTNPGLLSPADKTKLDSIRHKYFLINGDEPGNSLLLQVNDSTAKARRLIFVGADVDSTDESLTVTITGGVGGGLSQIIAGYGQTQVNDSTVDNDSLVMANRAWVMDRIAEIDTANVLFDSLGTAGISPVTVRNDTLYSRRISVTGGIIDTTASGGIEITVTGGLSNPMTTIGDIIQATTAGAADRLAAVATGNALISGGVASPNSWGKIGLTTHVSGILPVANGGTNSATQNWVDLTTTQATIAGAKTFTNNFTTSAKLYGIGGIYSYSVSEANGNLIVGSTNAITLNTVSQYLFKSASGANYRMGMGGNSNTTLTAGYNYGSFVIGEMGSVEAATGTHAVQANLVVLAPNFFNGAGATTHATSLYIEGAATGTATPTEIATALYVDDGPARFDGIFNSNNVNLTANQLWGANSGATSMEGKTLTEGQNFNITHGAGTITLAGPTLTKNLMLENPTSAENIFWFVTDVAITVSSVSAVLVGSSTPSVTYQVSFGTDRTSGTNVYTAGQTVTSTTTLTAASGVNDATIPAGSMIWVTTSAQSGTVGQINIKITYTED